MSPYGSELIHVKLGFRVHYCFTSTRRDCTGVLGTEGWVEGGRGGGTEGAPKTATSTFTQLLSSDKLTQAFFKRCFTVHRVHEDVRGGGKPRTATSTFAQLLSSVSQAFRFCFSVALRPQKPLGLLGTRGAQDVHRDCHYSPRAMIKLGPSSNVALRPQRPYAPLGIGGGQDGHRDFHTAPELG